MMRSASDLKIFVLGHEELQLSRLAENALLEKVNLSYLKLPIQNTNDIAENRFFLVDEQTFANCPEYIGVLSVNYNKKYPHLLPLQNMESIISKLQEDVVFAASPTETFCEGKWIDYSCKYHLTLKKYLEDMANTFHFKLENKPTLWANNFICHKKVFLEFIAFFKKVFSYMHQKYAYTYQMKVDDPTRTAAYVYERISMFFFANRSDLQIKRIPSKDPFKLSDINFVSIAGSNYDILTKTCLKSLEACGVNSEDIHHEKMELPNDISHQVRFGSDVWYLAIKKKINFLIQYLQSKLFCDRYKYFVCHDCDIQFFPGRLNHWEEMLSSIDSTDFDFYFQPEIVEKKHELCGGFYLIKKNRLQRAINFLSLVKNELENTPEEKMKYADQTIIKKMQDKIKFTLLPDKYCQFAGFVNIEHKDSYLFHHAINACNIQEKLNQMRFVRNWIKTSKTTFAIK